MCKSDLGFTGYTTGGGAFEPTTVPYYGNAKESEPQYQAQQKTEQCKQAATKAVYYSTITVTELRRRRDELQLAA